MDLEQLKNFVRETLNGHKRIIKPWKMRTGSENESATYADGWNDCLKEIEKNHKQFMTYTEKKAFQE